MTPLLRLHQFATNLSGAVAGWFLDGENRRCMACGAMKPKRSMWYVRGWGHFCTQWESHYYRRVHR